MNTQQLIPAHRGPANPLQTKGWWHRHALLLARLAVISIGVLTLVLWIAGLSSRFVQLQTICSVAPCGPQQPTQESIALFQASGISLGFYATYTSVCEVLYALAHYVVAALILRRRPVSSMALFAALGLITWGYFNSGPSPLLRSQLGAAWALEAYQLIGTASLVVFCYVFPNGRFVPRWTWVGVVLWAVLDLPDLFAPDSLLNIQHYPALVLVTELGWIVITVGAQIYRYRRVSTREERQQTKWVVFGVALALLGNFSIAVLVTVVPWLEIPGSLPFMIDNTLVYAFMAWIPLSIGLAILRHRLWGIAPLVNRALVYAGLTAGVIGMYVLIVGYLGALFRTGSNLLISLIATGVVAVLFQPLRAWLQRGVNRLIYGRRDEPYAVLAHLGKQIQGVLAPGAVLPTIVQTVREALRLPYVAIELLDEDEPIVTATAGVPTGDVLRLPLIYQHSPIGTLLLAQRSPGEPFGSAEMQLLTDLAHQIAVAAHAVQLTTDLQRSRERLILAREEERRRLRRDLHDDLAPTLAGLALSAGTAANLTHTDPDTARTLMLDLRAAIRGAVGDIRRLVYDLRPPTLDEFGLVAAIRERAVPQQSGGMAGAAPNGDDLRVIVEAPERLPPLPAAVEVAAYRIVQEALMNVRRHACARVCHIGVAVDDGGLHIMVLDDGVGLPAAYQRGVGLRSIEERAAELGGTCAIDRVAEGGTCITVLLPVSKGV